MKLRHCCCSLSASVSSLPRSKGQSAQKRAGEALLSSSTCCPRCSWSSLAVHLRSPDRDDEARTAPGPPGRVRGPGHPAKRPAPPDGRGRKDHRGAAPRGWTFGRKRQRPSSAVAVDQAALFASNVPPAAMSPAAGGRIGPAGAGEPPPFFECAATSCSALLQPAACARNFGG